MSDQTLAQFSMLSLYSAMGVLTLAMLAFAAHLAWLLPARDEAAEHVEEYELVAAGASVAPSPARQPAPRQPATASPGKIACP